MLVIDLSVILFALTDLGSQHFEVFSFALRATEVLRSGNIFQIRASGSCHCQNRASGYLQRIAKEVSAGWDLMLLLLFLML